MEPVPPPLTPEQMETIFAPMAQTGVVGLRKVGARLEAAETDEAVERLGRTLQTVGRYVRQTLALKLRFDREQAGIAAELRREAEVERKETQRVREVAIDHVRKPVRDHFDDALWDEYEPDDVEELLDGVDHQLDTLIADDPAFLDIPLDTLIQHVADQLGLPDLGEDAASPDDDCDPSAEQVATEAPDPRPDPPPAAIDPPAVPEPASTDPASRRPDYEADWGDPPPTRDRRASSG